MGMRAVFLLLFLLLMHHILSTMSIHIICGSGDGVLWWWGGFLGRQFCFLRFKISQLPEFFQTLVFSCCTFQTLRSLLSKARGATPQGNTVHTDLTRHSPRAPPCHCLTLSAATSNIRTALANPSHLRGLLWGAPAAIPNSA